MLKRLAPTPLRWFRRDGDGLPVVFLHGLLETSAIWEPVVDALPDTDRPLLALPLPGHAMGEDAARLSDDLHDGTFIDRYADVLRRTFDGPVRLVGHSTGGLVALQMARRHPDLVHDMALVGTLFSGGLDGTRSLSARITEIPFVGPLTFAWVIRYWLADPARFRRGVETVLANRATDLALPERMRTELAQIYPEALHAVALWLGRQCVRENLAEIRQPALCIIGTQDPVVPPAHQLDLIKALPNGHALLMKTGHLPFLEDPTRFRALFLRWLAGRSSPLATQLA
ncbi:alpha/beta fold hydrolase [Aestuariibius sp. 2305UL40-4]|uniref:alpha/beta fold hydrolase n=1 Tax=Aestuariibius violaceus TaxID=3234132 RepID=UPI00345F057C